MNLIKLDSNLDQQKYTASSKGSSEGSSKGSSEDSSEGLKATGILTETESLDKAREKCHDSKQVEVMIEVID